MNKKILPSKIRDIVISSLEELKAINPVSINVKKISNFTDYMLIASGTSNRHIKSVGDRVMEDLRDKDINPLGIEGAGSDEWVLIDLGVVVLNLMSEKARSYYDLESLWDPDLIK